MEIDNDKEEWDLVALNHPQAHYTAEQKISAVTYYAITGSIYKSSQYTAIPEGTISKWKNESPWWPEALAQVRKRKQDELDSVLTGIIDDATKEVVDRIANGDEVVDKNGEIHRKKISGRDLATILAILFDKRALLRGDPTSRTEKVTSEALLEKLKSEMEEFAKKLQTGNTIIVMENKKNDKEDSARLAVDVPASGSS